MTESFAELFEQSQQSLSKLRSGAIVSGLVVEIRSDVVVVNAGLKSEGIIPIEQFKNDNGELEISVGDNVKVALDAIENGFGETMLSREKAKRSLVWDELEEAQTANAAITGRISGKVKGGFTVDIKDVRAFLPGSLVDVRPVRDPIVPRRQGTRIQDHQARPQAQQRRGLASRRRRERVQRRARTAARQAAGRRDRQGRRQEPHRLRRVRRPRRHRWPAAHHRHGVEARASSVRSRQRRRRARRRAC